MNLSCAYLFWLLTQNVLKYNHERIRNNIEQTLLMCFIKNAFSNYQLACQNGARELKNLKLLKGFGHSYV